MDLFVQNIFKSCVNEEISLGAQVSIYLLWPDLKKKKPKRHYLPFPQSQQQNGDKAGPKGTDGWVCCWDIQRTPLTNTVFNIQ